MDDQNRKDKAGKRGRDVVPSSSATAAIGNRSLSVDIKQADVMLAREMNSLSMKERNEVLADIHGVVDYSQSKEIEEDDGLMDSKLQEMDKALAENFKPADRVAYDRALFLSPRFVANKDFRKAFLRADRYDPTKAAVRYMKYFQNKLLLFGEEKLCKRVEWNDLDKDDQDELMTGSYQILPEPDSQGRCISINSQKYFNYKSWQSKLRGIWYSIMCAMEDERAQRTGLVNIFWVIDVGVTENLYFDLIRHVSIIEESLPYRSVGNHYCYNNPSMRPALNLLQLVAGKDNRVRFRVHRGSQMECQFALMTFGISQSILPYNEDGDLQGHYMEDFRRKRLSIEAERREAQGDRVDYPSMNDVLLGRGRPYQYHPGNVHLANLIKARREEYNSADRWQKTVISYDVARMVADNGGRFLQRQDSGWKVVDQGVARDKVASSFRVRVRLLDSNRTSEDTSSNHRQKRSKMEDNTFRPPNDRIW
eukprot:CAMPEP_0113451484 /NCGR_PEP_ID=MMETSP0014_2-20120614/6361_1 /TAXON_ID=2857 /ORGANISM="Nitzschia sp." /LENGTH=478 /DNA_ID=CAMNT_0000342839 /DNA_START=182 /DNA_END=1618 /DNA_ORIENTATION=- /assembly_acc=CAM_ASM_000159